ncbi:bifunctional aldehyde dehydrogenase/enoyl-CoA hydratase [Halalkalicoccus paucihalophilus]|uniref:Bifunctional aldehyde dehydrogenase/enoyl-CoA hydratase n=1 Tax=Halalkalicoccus paucihalophilus TaxID=1008153 RepID=A0A151A8H9_9EURY|nr:MaoC/PaaZ C-terminal domain-containing protein [Halalkalicoccus paucihalophilus]KYH23860.1 bifunctional aldehyde dehydrogenase/enoyl-CoA hydratase [Halalkalicoccus paucihalophilus]
MRRSDDLIRFEAIEPGTTVRCGKTTVSEDDIVEFAERYDPLAIHTDPAAAAESRFGGLIASGYHTLCLSVRLLVEDVRSERAVVGGLGIDDVRWHRPIEPGDTISVRNEVLNTRLSESDPSVGIVHEAITVTNQREEIVLSYENHELVARRE